MNNSKPKLVYIYSPSFSGSTLLTLSLSQHPKIATIGELKATSMGPIQEYYCTCGSLINECAFWKELENEMHRLGHQFTPAVFGTHFRSFSWLTDKILHAQIRGSIFEFIRKTLMQALPFVRNEFNRILDQNYYLMKSILKLQKGEFFLDSSKDPQRLKYFQQSGSYDIYVIKLYRHGLAQSHSRRRKLNMPIDFLGAVNEWKSTVLQMESVATQIPSQKMKSVSYENFCSQPEVVMKSILAWLNLDPLQPGWSHSDLMSDSLHILGNSMRTQKQILIREDDSWRSAISEKEKSIFEKVAGSLNKKLGYE